MSIADDNHDPAAVTRLVTYLYQDDYDDLEELPPSMDIRAINSARREELAEWIESRYSLSTIEGLIERTQDSKYALFTPGQHKRDVGQPFSLRIGRVPQHQRSQGPSPGKVPWSCKIWVSNSNMTKYPAMIKATYCATSAKDEGIRGPILRKLAEDYCENQGLLAHERCVQALKEHRDFAVGLMEAIRKHLQ